jgi:hypothetical protein
LRSSSQPTAKRIPRPSNVPSPIPRIAGSLPLRPKSELLWVTTGVDTGVGRTVGTGSGVGVSVGTGVGVSVAAGVGVATITTGGGTAGATGGGGAAAGGGAELDDALALTVNWLDFAETLPEVAMATTALRGC